MNAIEFAIPMAVAALTALPLPCSIRKSTDPSLSIGSGACPRAFPQAAATKASGVGSMP
jgi:hypothetical protein